MIWKENVSGKRVKLVLREEVHFGFHGHVMSVMIMPGDYKFGHENVRGCIRGNFILKIWGMNGTDGPKGAE